MNVRSLCAPWVALHEGLGLGGPVRDEQHYEQLLEVAEWLMDEVARDQSSPFGGLAELVADRIREYEVRVHPWPDDATPTSVLAFLMQQHGLRQSDLPEVGTQSVVFGDPRGQARAQPAAGARAVGALRCADGGVHRRGRRRFGVSRRAGVVPYAVSPFGIFRATAPTCAI